MGEYQSILPHSSTKLEVDLDKSAHEIMERVGIPLRQLNRPYEIAAELLPWLAWAVGVEIWVDSWPDDVKRSVISTELERKRRRGTPWAVREYVRIAGSEVLRIIVPPASFFWAPINPDLSGWRDSLPQLRIYPYAKRGSSEGMFYDADHYTDPDDEDAEDVLGETYQAYMPDTGNRYRSRYAKLFKDGQSYDVSWASAYTLLNPDGQEAFSLPGKAWDDDLFWGSWYPDVGYLDSGRPSKKVLTVKTGGQIEYLTPGATPISITPERVGQLVPNSPAFYENLDYYGMDYYLEDQAYLGFYERYRIYEPDINDIEGSSISGYGYFGTTTMKYGIPPFTAEVVVDTVRKMPNAAIVGYLDGFWLPEDVGKFDKAMEALRVAKARRDRVYANPTLKKQVTFGTRPTLPFRLGDYVET